MIHHWVISYKSQGDKLEELQAYITKHRWHIHNLEALLRMLDNSTVDLEDVSNFLHHYLYDFKCTGVMAAFASLLYLVSHFVFSQSLCSHLGLGTTLLILFFWKQT